MDDTLTRAKSLITPDMRKALLELMGSGRDVIVVSGQTNEYIGKQTDELPTFYLCQNGNHALDAKTGKEFWRYPPLTKEECDEIFTHIRSIPRDWPVTDENDLVENRGQQISYSLLGQHEDVARKQAFDPDRSKRKQILKEHPLISEHVEVFIGGTTTFDYIRKGMHKGRNVMAFIKEMGWKPDECIYVGDALFPGGNDETVMGVIDTKSVANPTETFAYIREVLAR